MYILLNMLSICFDAPKFCYRCAFAMLVGRTHIHTHKKRGMKGVFWGNDGGDKRQRRMEGRNEVSVKKRGIEGLW